MPPFLIVLSIISSIQIMQANTGLMLFGKPNEQKETKKPDTAPQTTIVPAPPNLFAQNFPKPAPPVNLFDGKINPLLGGNSIKQISQFSSEQ